MYTYDDLINVINKKYGIDVNILHRLTNIPAEIIRNNPRNHQRLTENEINIHSRRNSEFYHLVNAISSLINKDNSIQNDDLLKSHIIAFSDTLGVPKTTIANFIGIDIKVLDSFIKGRSISIDEKYKIAVRSFFLVWLFTKNPYIDI